MAAMASGGGRSPWLRVLEPAVGVATGGTRVVLHGKGFRAAPHSLVVRFRLPETGLRIDVVGKFLLETQLECQVPSVSAAVATAIAHHTRLPPTSAMLALAPYVVSLWVEVIMDSERVSNALPFQVHHALVIQRITPHYVLLSPPTTVTVTLNLLKLSIGGARHVPVLEEAPSSQSTSPTTAGLAQQDSTRLVLCEISALPVFVRVRQVSERTGATSERTVPARWKVSATGVFELEFDAVMLTFGDTTIDVTLNKADYFRGKSNTPAAIGYSVHRDVSLENVEPCAISVTSGRITEVRVLGEGFVDSGDIVVRLLQRETLKEVEEEEESPRTCSPKEVVIAQLTATFENSREVRCSVHPNLAFGLTALEVSLNGGRQFGKSRMSALLYRDRVIERITPPFGPLDGDTCVAIQYEKLPLDHVDAPRLVHRFVPQRRIRVKFQAMHDDGTLARIAKIVNVDITHLDAPITDQEHKTPESHCTWKCRSPSFIEEMKSFSDAEHVENDNKELVAPEHIARVRRFQVSIALGSDIFFGALEFCYHSPIVIRSITQHHGPMTGGSIVSLRMKHRVPPVLPISVRFMSLTTGVSEVVPGRIGTTDGRYKQDNARAAGTGSNHHIQSPRSNPMDNLSSLIVCSTPAWTKTPTNIPHLTKVQVSFDGGFNFMPVDGEKMTKGGHIPPGKRSRIPSALTKDMTYLYFLFYPPPRLFSIVPMSADTQGGSFVRISGDNVVDHGGQISVIFKANDLSQRVVGFIENGEIHCCTPPFIPGRVTLFVSFNAEQYTKCEFIDPDSKAPIDFVYYRSPYLERLSPLCVCVCQSSALSIYGANLIETGRIKVRVGIVNQQRRMLYKDVEGKARDGVIWTQSPLFTTDYGGLTATVDVALNGSDFSGMTLPLHYYSAYTIKKVEPPLGAFEISIPVTLYVSENLISDILLVRVRFTNYPTVTDPKGTLTESVTSFGPIQATEWSANQVKFDLPAIAAHVPSFDTLKRVLIDISFDGAYFHQLGDLRDHYRIYTLPSVQDIQPRFGIFDQETQIVAHCFNISTRDIVKMMLTLDGVSIDTCVDPCLNSSSGDLNHVAITEVNIEKQQLTWRCPSFRDMLNFTGRSNITTDTNLSSRSMLLSATVNLKISTVDGQWLDLPFVLQYFRPPMLLQVSPRMGYICGGSLVSFEFKEKIETPTVDIRFGTCISNGRVYDHYFVECYTPMLHVGIHDVAIAFDGQHFQDAVVFLKAEACASRDPKQETHQAELQVLNTRSQESIQNAPIWVRDGVEEDECTPRRVFFQAYSVPTLSQPPNRRRIVGFGPIEGGSLAIITGRGFVPGIDVFVLLSSHSTNFFQDSKDQEVTLKAQILDGETIQCIVPPVSKPGRVTLQISYNLREYSESTYVFEYHKRTRFASQGVLCGPVSGGTPVVIKINGVDGLPEKPAELIHGTFRFIGQNQDFHQDAQASFDSASLSLSCVSPAWPSNELCSVHIALARGRSEQFVDSGVRFLFYDPPQGLIMIEPKAGPVSGETQVHAWCGKIVDTGEITVSITMLRSEDALMDAPAICSEHTLNLINETADDCDVSEGRVNGMHKTLPSSSMGEMTKEESSKDDSESYIVRGNIIGEAVCFTTPAVSRPGTAYLSIALNGIDYTTARTSTLRFTYYKEPTICRISPIWSSTEMSDTITVHGRHIQDHGCAPKIKLRPQMCGDAQPSVRNSDQDEMIVESSFVADNGESPNALQCVFQAAAAGSYEVEISLNGQQFTSSRYISAAFGNYNGAACAALLPFRWVVAPFYLATSAGPVAGGSTVVIYVGKRVGKILCRETKCPIQFTPIKSIDFSSSESKSSISSFGMLPVASTSNPQKQVNGLITTSDTVTVTGDIDHTSARVTCRAPLLRSSCVATVDILIPPTSEGKNNVTSCAAFFNVREKELYYAYESPSITEIVPSCGPTSGGTCLVIQVGSIVDTGQIFVRFRSCLNERECVLVPARYSTEYPDGTPSSSPLIICHTPQVEFIERVVNNDGTGVLPPASIPGEPAFAHALSPSRVREGGAGKVRTHSFQQMAEQSLRAYNSQPASLMASSVNDSDLNSTSGIVLRISRAMPKNTPRTGSVDGPPSANVFVDFTLNAGEQFIAHSVPFHFYASMTHADVKWSPRHLTTRCLDRISMETRVLSVQLPSSVRLVDAAADRVSFRFDGAPQLVYSDRRGSRVVLHETRTANELLMLDPPKLSLQSVIRKKSKLSRSSSVTIASINEPNRTSTATPSGSRVRTRTSPTPNRGSGVNERVTFDSTKRRVSSSPSIAAKVTRGNELTCTVPEFSASGVVHVFFSLNAQQFVYLGELYIHDPLTIRESTEHRFCSSIGGDRFLLECSASTVFEFLLRRNVTNEVDVAMASKDICIAKPSRFLSFHGRTDEEHFSSNGTSGDRNPGFHASAMGFAHHNQQDLEPCWQQRLFHVAQVHVVPPNPRILKRIKVAVSHVGSKVEIASGVPDDYGRCVFETTDWIKDVIVTASERPTSAAPTPGNTGPVLNAYSCVLGKSQFHPDRSELAYSDDCAEVCPPTKSHILLVQLPPPQVIRFVAFSQDKTVVMLVNRQGIIVNSIESAAMPVSDGIPRITSLIVDTATLDTSQDSYFLCVGLSGEPTPLSSSMPNQEIQCVAIDSGGALVYMTGNSVGRSGIWIVACISQREGEFTVFNIDHFVNALSDMTADAVLAVSVRLPRRELREEPTATTANLRVQFACAESQRKLSVTSLARVILPGEWLLDTFMKEQPTWNVMLECEMPGLPFNGPTVISVVLDGTTLSNSICVHCYDPRLWRILALHPPCGLTQTPLTLRVTGQHFVENHKLLIRLSDESRCMNLRASMARFNLVIVRITGIKDIRSLLPPHLLPAPSNIIGNGGGDESSSPRRHHRKQHTSSTHPRTVDRGPSNSTTPFTITAKLECAGQVFMSSCRESVIHAAIASSSPLVFPEQFEIPTYESDPLLLVTLELFESTSAHPVGVEIGRSVISLATFRPKVLSRASYPIETHFLRPGTPQPNPPTMEMFFHPSPVMMHQAVAECQLPAFHIPQRLRVQVSSGDSFFSPCNDLVTRAGNPGDTVIGAASDMQSSYPSLYDVYELPVVTHTSPCVLPRSTGGGFTITGRGFLSCSGGDRIRVRIFACGHDVVLDSDEDDLLRSINAVRGLQPCNSQFFVRDLTATFESSTVIKCVLPPNLTSYKIYYRVTMDGREHSLATVNTRILLFSTHQVTPCGGPVSGNTYAALHGTNIDTCLASASHIALVRLTWTRGARELESVTVRGDVYPREDAVYFYTPQSKFGLQNIDVHIELSLHADEEGHWKGSNSTLGSGVGSAVSAFAANARFSKDRVTFFMYRIPTIKSVAPITSLVCGVSRLELLVQGQDENATTALNGTHKTRYKCRGQMQIADVQVCPGGKMAVIVPRFNVIGAVATTISHETVAAPLKVWRRHGALFITVLRARGLHVPKKSTCNPFVVIRCNKIHLKSTRKDGTLDPVWNELFDFDWRDQNEAVPHVWITIENQLTIDQSEQLGHVDLTVSDAAWRPSEAFCVRAWFPLQSKMHSRAATTVKHVDKFVHPSLGALELAVAYLPALTNGKDHRSTKLSLHASALMSTIRSTVQQINQQQRQKQAKRLSQPGVNDLSLEEEALRKKERLIRAFRSETPSVSSPSDVVVELALNGQDFASVAPSRCTLAPIPIVVDSLPPFICMSGGTPLSIRGMNFLPTGCIRVAFSITPADEPSNALSTDSTAAAGKAQADATNSIRVLVVDAKHRSSALLTCITPSLHTLAAETSIVSISVALNGLDFDSIALPTTALRAQSLNTTTVPVVRDKQDTRRETSEDATNSTIKTNQECSGCIKLSNGQYVLDPQHLTSGAPNNSSDLGATLGKSRDASVMQQRVRIYLRPVVLRVCPADGVYTTYLVIEGKHFTDTGIAIVRFTSTTQAKDARTAPLRVISPRRMECETPDFPRGTVVTLSIAMNGIEFVACPGTLAVFQSPRLTELVPTWISSGGSMTSPDLRLRGVNLNLLPAPPGVIKSASTTSKARSRQDEADGTNATPICVKVSFTRLGVTRVVPGRCVNDEVICSSKDAVDLVQSVCTTASDGPDGAENNESDESQSEISPPIFVDVCLGDIHSKFTGRPLELHMYRHIPTIASVSPMNGPIYGNFLLTIHGRGFIDTGFVQVRLEFCRERSPLAAIEREVETKSVNGGDSGHFSSEPTENAQTNMLTAQHPEIEAPIEPHALPIPTRIHVVAHFVSDSVLVCTLPSLPREGIYTVAVALNGVEFSAITTTTWVLVWQNWQRRKHLLLPPTKAAVTLNSSINEDITTTTTGTSTTTLETRLPLITTGALPTKPLQSTVAPSPRSRSRGIPELPRYRDAASTVVHKVRESPVSPSRNEDRALTALEKMVAAEALEHPQDYLVDPRKLQWRPASIEDKSRSLLLLMVELFNAPETQQIMIRRMGYIFRTKGERNAASGQWMLTHLPVFSNAMRVLFPVATDRDLNELWIALTPMTTPGLDRALTLSSLTRLLVSDASVEQGREWSRQPEPGPTHYSPRHTLTEPTPPVPLILPEGDGIPDRIAGVASEMVMNYDAFKAVRPRIVGGSFPRRKFNTSWCNPVSKEDDNTGNAAKEEDTERALAKLREALAPETQGPRPPQIVLHGCGNDELAADDTMYILRPPQPDQGRCHSDANGNACDRAASTHLTLKPGKEKHGGSESDMVSELCGSHEGEIARNETATPSKVSSPRSARRPSICVAPHPPTENPSPPASAGGGAAPPTAGPRASRSRSILHHDIAPLYLKFLNSKDVKKMTKR